MQHTNKRRRRRLRHRHPKSMRSQPMPKWRRMCSKPQHIQLQLSKQFHRPEMWPPLTTTFEPDLQSKPMSQRRRLHSPELLRVQLQLSCQLSRTEMWNLPATTRPSVRSQPLPKWRCMYSKLQYIQLQLPC